MMKQKYILEIFDDIIREIKNPKLVTDSKIILALKDCSMDSYHIHKVLFEKQEECIGYEIKKPVHNLHPNALELKNLENLSCAKFKSFIPEILAELNIQQSSTEYHFRKHKDNNNLYVIVNCKIEDLSEENRFFLYCYNLLKQENEQIKQTTKEIIFGLKSEESIEHYIHKKQYALENLAYQLIRDINPNTSIDIYEFSSNHNKIDCLKLTYIYLEKLLRFIEKEYHNYLNVNIRVPYRTILLKEFEIADKLNYVKSRLLSSNINERLLKLTYEPLLKIATINIQENITYYEFNYCSEFITEFHKQLKDKIEDVVEVEIKEWLFDLNFNSLYFFDYWTDEINVELEKHDTNIEKIDVLYKSLKNYNQKQTQNFMKFNNKLPTIKEQVVGWIEEEIEYLSKKIKLDANLLFSTKNNDTKIKIQTALSVAQLSYFFSLLIQSGILKHKNQTDLFRFIADNFKTNITDQISADSIKSKYYNVESTTKNATRLKIIELLNLTKL
jgi:hypothetical protein